MDPNPIKHPGVLLSHIRGEVEPLLLAAGFEFDARNNPQPQPGNSLWIDYRCDSHLFSLRWDRWIARLATEILDSAGVVAVIAEVSTDGVRSHDELMKRVAPLIEKTKSYLECHHGRDFHN